MGGLGAAPAQVAVTPPISAETEGVVSGDDQLEVTDEVTTVQVGAARRVLQEHRRVCVPEAVCNWCLTAWPCPDVVWAWHVLRDEE